MSFLDRCEFEQITDKDLAVNRNQWQSEIVNSFQSQLSQTSKMSRVSINDIFIESIDTKTSMNVPRI